VSGKLRPVGGDWLTIRKHGVAILDVRATIETHDGALIDSDIVAADNQTITIIIRYLYGHRHPEAGEDYQHALRRPISRQVERRGS